MISTILTMLLLLSGCGGIKKLQDIRLTSAAIGNISPSGLRGMKLDIVVGVDNPGTEVSFSDISCSLKHSGKVLGKLAVDRSLFMREQRRTIVCILMSSLEMMSLCLISGNFLIRQCWMKPWWT